ncbi:hypothetical protein U0070_004490 [Myodes glareolus]|uniref:Large ribosomal subunit protein P2 n=1 Tax=Myodes glareolus TaxID=447135 RepID=A0AAW0IBE1_MYOGA
MASCLLAALGGSIPPSAKDIKKILDSVGIEGVGKLASVPAGGVVAVSAAPGSVAPAAGSVPAAAEEKKKEKKKSEESNDDMGICLFD